MNTTGNPSYLIFDVDTMQYAVPIEYVSFIVTAAEQFPTCIPPKMPAHVKCVMQMEQGLVPIVDLMMFPGFGGASIHEKTYPLILIISYQNSQIGLLTDHITIASTEADKKAEKESLGQHLFIALDGKKIALFDVEKIYYKLNNG